MRVITAKLLEDKLKMGWGTDQFTEYYDLTTEEFHEAIQALGKTAADTYQRRIKTNDRRIKRGLKKRRAKAAVVPRDNDVATSLAKDKSEGEKNVETPVDRLEKLISERDRLRNCIISLEKKRKEEISKRQEAYKKTTILKKEMLELRAKIESCRAKTRNLINEIDQISATIKTINGEKADAKETLSLVEEEIAELRKVEVYVDGDNIEIVPPEYEIPEGWKELRTSWIDEERFALFTVAEITTLAKAVLLKSTISDRRSEFIFASDQMEKLFNEFTNSNQ